MQDFVIRDFFIGQGLSSNVPLMLLGGLPNLNYVILQHIRRLIFKNRGSHSDA